MGQTTCVAPIHSIVRHGNWRRGVRLMGGEVSLRGMWGYPWWVSCESGHPGAKGSQNDSWEYAQTRTPKKVVCFVEETYPAGGVGGAAGGATGGTIGAAGGAMGVAGGAMGVAGGMPGACGTPPMGGMYIPVRPAPDPWGIP